MFVRMPLTGAGTPDDPYDTLLPTHRIVAVNYVAKVAICEVPDDDSPPDTDAPGTALYPQIGQRNVLIGLRPLQKLAWIARVRRKYGAALRSDPNDPA